MTSIIETSIPHLNAKIMDLQPCSKHLGDLGASLRDCDVQL